MISLKSIFYLLVLLVLSELSDDIKALAPTGTQLNSKKSTTSISSIETSTPVYSIEKKPTLLKKLSKKIGIPLLLIILSPIIIGLFPITHLISSIALRIEQNISRKNLLSMSDPSKKENIQTHIKKIEQAQNILMIASMTLGLISVGLLLILTSLPLYVVFFLKIFAIGSLVALVLSGHIFTLLILFFDYFSYFIKTPSLLIDSLLKNKSLEIKNNKMIRPVLICLILGIIFLIMSTAFGSFFASISIAIPYIFFTIGIYYSIGLLACGVIFIINKNNSIDRDTENNIDSIKIITKENMKDIIDKIISVQQLYFNKNAINIEMIEKKYSNSDSNLSEQDLFTVFKNFNSIKTYQSNLINKRTTFLKWLEHNKDSFDETEFNNFEQQEIMLDSIIEKIEMFKKSKMNLLDQIELSQNSVNKYT